MLFFSAREKSDPASKSTKRLAENQEVAETRRSKRKKYQRAIEQRAEAEEKNAVAKFDKLTADDPTVAPTYDLWNVRDEKKGKLDDLGRCFNIPSSRKSSKIGRARIGFVHGTSLSDLRLESPDNHHQETNEVTGDRNSVARHVVQSDFRGSSGKSLLPTRLSHIHTLSLSLCSIGTSS